MKVSEIMSKTLTIVEPEATLGEAATMMGERHVGSVVVCEDDRLVGILTERDIVRALSRVPKDRYYTATEMLEDFVSDEGPDDDGPERRRQRGATDDGGRRLPAPPGSGGRPCGRDGIDPRRRGCDGRLGHEQASVHPPALARCWIEPDHGFLRRGRLCICTGIFHRGPALAK